MSEPILSAKKLRKAFDRSRVILEDVDADILPGEFAVIMGPSGAGKSTLLYCMSLMDRPDAGQLVLDGQELTAMSEKQLSAVRGRDFGFVFQQTHLVSYLTLRENVAVAGYLCHGTEETDRRAEALLTQMGVGDAADRLPGDVSGGEAQRAAVARAVINEPKVLFADEPTGALNRGNTEEVLSLFTRLNEAGQTILMVTHDAHAASRGSRVLYLEDGRIIGEKSLGPWSPEAAREREQALTEWLTALRW